MSDVWSPQFSFSLGLKEALTRLRITLTKGVQPEEKTTVVYDFEGAQIVDSKLFIGSGDETMLDQITFAFKSMSLSFSTSGKELPGPVRWGLGTS